MVIHGATRHVGWKVQVVDDTDDDLERAGHESGQTTQPEQCGESCDEPP
jgi:hypothetical protein